MHSPQAPTIVSAAIIPDSIAVRNAFAALGVGKPGGIADQAPDAGSWRGNKVAAKASSLKGWKMLPNEQIARRLDELAALLNEQRASIYRVAAWRRAAMNLRRLAEPVSSIYAREGIDGLRSIPGVGDHIATAIRSLIVTGRLPMLERMRGEVDPIDLLMSVPGIGRIHAARLHFDLGIDSLEELEAAAHDGRLATLAGFGQKRIAGISDALASRLCRVRADSLARETNVPVSELLAVDAEYRESSAAGRLPKIAPRRFNPDRVAWLPILHTQRGGRHYTVLFSNTARAHEVGRCGDWVVIYWDAPGGERQFTVITCPQGVLKGRRIVRGRELECAQYYGRTAMRTAAG